MASQESQHELQEPQEPSGSKHDPNEPENIFWYIVQDGQYSMCLMGFNSTDADAFENDTAEYGTTFTLIGQGQHAEQQARSELDEYFHEYSVHAPTPSQHNDTLYYIVQPHGMEATVEGMTAEEADDFEACGYTVGYEMWEPEAYTDLNYTVFYLYVGEGQAAEQEARRDLHNFNPSGYNPSHDSQGTPQTETNSIEQSASSIEHNSKLGSWINGFGPESNQLEINMSLLVQSQMVQAQCNAHYNLGSPPDSRHDPEAAPYNLGSPPDSRHDPEAAHYIKPALDTAPYNLGSPHDSRHDPEAALYNKPTLYTSPGGEADDFEYWMLYTRPPAMTSGGRTST